MIILLILLLVCALPVEARTPRTITISSEYESVTVNEDSTVSFCYCGPGRRVSVQSDLLYADEDTAQNGLYYRLTDERNAWFTAWQTVSEDQRTSIVSLVVQNVEPYKSAPHLRLKGLDPDAVYEIEEEHIAVSGAALMRAGYTFPRMLGDYPAAQLHLKKKETVFAKKVNGQK